MLSSTIAAVATPLGTGGIGVVRISGGQALEVADRMLKTAQYDKVSLMDGYTCAYGRAYDRDGEIDEAVVTVFRAPRSYTGEDVVEISCHGGVYVVGRILRACIDCGARMAQAGEFTRRAFLNGKLDLTRAEAVADLISARGKLAAKAALTARDGALYRKLEQVGGRLVSQAAHLAAWIDYPEEEIIEVDGESLRRELAECGGELETLLSTYDAGKVVREGIDVAIVGRPNAGKSTLMNLMAGYDRSIVAEIAGTTRDVVSDTVQLGELVLNLSDTAGIHESDDPVERAGVRLAEERLQRAQLVLAVFDGSETLGQDDLRVMERCRGMTCIALVNKNDLPQRVDLEKLRQAFGRVLAISAKDGQGAAELEAAIRELFLGGSFDSSAAMVANERQRDGVRRALGEVREAAQALDAGVSYDAVCVCIENAVDCLLELTGRRATQEVVDQVFARFCVGK